MDVLIENKTDKELIINIKEKLCDLSLNELIKRHEKLVFQIFNNYCRRTPSLNYTDLLAESSYLIYDCALRYNPTKKTKFSTWVGHNARYLCLNLMKKEGCLINLADPDIDNYLNKNNTFNFEKQSEFLDYILNILRQLNDTRIEKIYKLRYFSPDQELKTFKEIGKKLNLSIMHVINLHNKGRELIYNKIKSNTIFDKV